MNLYRASGIMIFLGIIDRLTKWYAIQAEGTSWEITPFLSFEPSYNHGITWGMFAASNSFMHALLTIAIGCFIIGFVWYALHEYRAKKIVWPHVLILVGAISNIIDRILYGGVIDFISFSYHGFSWPIFNLADVYIVIGVCALLVIQWQE